MQGISDRHHICKHIVQAVSHPPLKFWRKVIRRRVIPIYCHPALVRKANNDGPGPAASYVDPGDGSIIDGDDHLHLGNPEFLHGEGGWRDLGLDIVLGKRCRNSADDFPDNGSVRSSSPVCEEEQIDSERDDGDTRSIR
jgi:hypothetical protein